MRIKAVKAERIYDSRKEETISIFVKTDKGLFSASSPSGKSKGKYEAKSYIESLNGDIKLISNYSGKLEQLNLFQFDDLEKVEKTVKLGANSLFALESAILKALAAEYKLSLWEFLNDKANRFPIPVGNCIGGGMHTRNLKGKKPDFQEFLILPRAKKFSDRIFLMNKAWEITGNRLKLRKTQGSLNDEGAWSTSLGNEEVLEIMQETREELTNQIDNKIGIGIDAASSSFYSGYVYDYKNPKKQLKSIEQINHISELINNYLIEYVEDGLNEEAFNDFRLLRESVIRTHPCLIVGDDLTTTNLSRLKIALNKGSINGIIIKPNQNGSLIQVKKIIELAKKHEIATIFSHRSGETLDNCVADLSFAFNVDFVKFGIKGKEREVKLNRLAEIEKNF